MLRHPGPLSSSSAASTRRAPTAPAVRPPLSSSRHTSSSLSHPSGGDNTARLHFGRSSIGNPGHSSSSSVRTPSFQTHSHGFSSGRNAASFIPKFAVGGSHTIEPLGTGIPSFRTSFDVSGKGGGAFRPISDSFAVNPANGTMSLSLPIQLSPTRAGGLSPDINLSYDSGSGNGPFGIGWNVALASVQRRTKDGVPAYVDNLDAFGMGGTDIVPALETDEKTLVKEDVGSYEVTTYRPRVDSGAMRIEKWMRHRDIYDVHWRVISAENVTSIYGLDDESRIMSKSAGKRQVAIWLISRSFDGKGNAMEYIYKPEDGAGLSQGHANGLMPIWERNRTQESRCHQKYIKRILYGNRTPCRDLDSWKATDEAWPKTEDWMFEVVFDYGEHDKESPRTAETQGWEMRQDPFSQNNFGFEVRTYRLCRRILMFHHFPKETGWRENLVASSDLGYQESPQATFLSRYTANRHVVESATSESDIADGSEKLFYKTESFPPWTFDYTKPPLPNQMKAAQANVANLMGIPQTGSSLCEWLDLDGEGIPGLLTRITDGTMSYQQNRGSVHRQGQLHTKNSSSSLASEPQFSVPEYLPQQPTLGRSTNIGKFEDLGHTGSLNLVHTGPGGEPQGFWERDDSDSWSVYSDFPPTPGSEFDKGSDHTVSIDLTGDGLPDVLYAMADSSELVWEQNLGKQGHTASRRTLSFASTDQPWLGLSNATETRTLVADMTGDGLADLVEVSQASIKFWPNQGHGKFGTVVEMGSPPVFACGSGDSSVFDPDRLRLIDVDGNGLTDVLYLLPGGGAHVYFNHAGNSWSKSHFVRALPATAVPSSVFTLDLFGQGSGCLCWADASTPSGQIELQFIDLMGGTKPHLLREYSNGFGSVTKVSYQPSTSFYLRDRQSGTPWSSKLPFPVQCLSQVTIDDQITGNSTTTLYAYHNGHFDPKEKAFAGFEMVEQWKTEKIVLGKDEVYEPPALYTKSWFGIGRGVTVDASRLFSPSVLSSELKTLTGNSNVSGGFQALKGKPLRTELYNLDGTFSEYTPHSVEELSYDIKQLQSKGPSKHAVFQVTPRSSLTTVYGRQIEDPKVSHAIVLKTNDFGDVEESLTVVYPRSKSFASSAPDSDDDVIRNQTAGNISHDRVWFTNAEGSVQTGCWVRPVAWRHQNHEIVGFKFPDHGILDVNQVRLFDFGALSETNAAVVTTSPQRALRSEEKTTFLNDSLSGLLDDGKIQSFSVVDKSYSMAFDPKILSKIRENQARCRVLGTDVEKLMSVGGYVKLDKDSTWWSPSAYVKFRPPEESIGSELSAARSRFYSPAIYVDPFKNSTILNLDENLLLAERVQNAVNGEITLENDYQHLQPVVITDENGIRQSVTLHTLGRRTCLAVLGKGIQSGDELELDADSMDNVHIGVTEEDVERVLRDPCGPTTRGLLGNAGSRVIYALNRSQNRSGSVSPATIITIARDSSFRRSDRPTLRINVTYLDGHGAPIQSLELSDPTASEQRWIVSEIAIGNASGQVIRTYDPFFVSSPDFITNSSLDKPASTTFFEPFGNQVGSLTPDGVWSKTIHTPWSLTEHDFGSMGMCSKPERDADIGHFFSRIKSTRYLPTWLQSLDTSNRSGRQDSTKSSVYFGTTTTTHLGSCGLPIRSALAEPGKTYVYSRSLAYDFSGNKVRDFDALGRLVEKNMYDKLHRRVLCSSMDAGDIGTILDVNGAVIYSWNSRGTCFLYEYDALRRETRKLLVNGTESAVLIIEATYGDSAPPEVVAKANLRGKLWKVHDQSGVHINDRFDIRGNVVETSFFVANEYKSVLDWRAPHRISLAPHPFQRTATYDNFEQVVRESDAKENETMRTFSRLGKVVSVQFHHAELEETEPCLLNATFAADGLPLSKTYNNGVMTTYTYDDLSRRLTREQSFRKAAAGRHEVVQDLSHVHDCVGRRIRTEDAVEQTQYFRGCAVGAKWEYSYDAIGNLTEAWGRGQLPTGGKGRGGRDVRLAAPNAMNGMKPGEGVTDGTRLYRYCESYTYDLCGNIMSMTHAAPDDQFVSGWTRRYYYEEPSSLADDGSMKSNRLTRTVVGETEDKYAYEGEAGLVGCITTLPRFSLLQWNFDNMLVASSGQDLDSGTPEMTYYVYDYAGKRVRKVTESSTTIPAGEVASDGSSRKMRDTLYLHGVEVQLRVASNSSKPASARTITRVTGDAGEVLSLVESSSDSDEVLERYQIGFNLELDDEGRLITYEEYSPFGTVAYTATHQAVEAPRSYRFARYEHDRETGLYHCGSRYYCPWLGRWTSPDPLGDVDGPNLFVYCGNDPIGLDDHAGTSFGKAGANFRLTPALHPPRSLRSQSMHDISLKKGTASSGAPAKFELPLVQTKQVKLEPFKSTMLKDVVPRNFNARGRPEDRVQRVAATRVNSSAHGMQIGMAKAARDFVQRVENTLGALRTVKRGDVQQKWDSEVGGLTKRFEDVKTTLGHEKISNTGKALAMEGLAGSFNALEQKTRGSLKAQLGQNNWIDAHFVNGKLKAELLNLNQISNDMVRDVNKFQRLSEAVENNTARGKKILEKLNRR